MSTERVHLPDENIRGGTYMVALPQFIPVMGTQGITGLQGPTGVQGTTGIYITVGVQGTTGLVGLTGETGLEGPTGQTGSTGIRGLTGIRGFTGLQGGGGGQGATGIRGMTGIAGIQGETGLIGSTGIQGILGNTGYTGIQGIGAAGSTGIRGLVGQQGQTGLAGGGSGTITGSGTPDVIAKFSGTPGWDTTATTLGYAFPQTLIKQGSNIFVGSSGGAGIYVSADGTNWSDSSSGCTSDQIQCFTTYYGSGTKLYAGSYGTGVFKSTNSGLTWAATTAVGSALNITSMGSTSGHVFAGTWGYGVYDSTNEGSTWGAVNNGITGGPFGCLYAKCMVVVGTGIYIGTWGGGIYFSSDNGANWSTKNTGLTSLEVESLVADGAGVMYAGSHTGGVFKSTDSGANWAVSGTTPAYIRSLAITGNTVFAGTSGGGLYISDDNGATWTQQSTPGTSTDVYALLTTATNVVYVADIADGLFVSTLVGVSTAIEDSVLTQTAGNLHTTGNFASDGTVQSQAVRITGLTTGPVKSDSSGNLSIGTSGVVSNHVMPVSDGTNYQNGPFSYDGTNVLTSASNLFPGQTVNAGQFLQQASSYITDTTHNIGWRDTIAWSPTAAQEYLEWAHFNGFGNWEDYVLRIRSDNNVQINNTLLLTDSTTVSYIGIASANQALVDDSVINDTVIRAATTGGGANHFKVLVTCDHGNSTGLSVMSPSNGAHFVGVGKANPQWTLDTKGSTYRVGISGDPGPSTPDSSGVVIYFDGSDLKAKRLDGKTATLSVTWA